MRRKIYFDNITSKESIKEGIISYNNDAHTPLSENLAKLFEIVENYDFKYNVKTGTAVYTSPDISFTIEELEVKDDNVVLSAWITDKYGARIKVDCACLCTGDVAKTLSSFISISKYVGELGEMLQKELSCNVKIGVLAKESKLDSIQNLWHLNLSWKGIRDRDLCLHVPYNADGIESLTVGILYVQASTIYGDIKLDEIVDRVKVICCDKSIVAMARSNDIKNRMNEDSRYVDFVYENLWDMILEYTDEGEFCSKLCLHHEAMLEDLQYEYGFAVMYMENICGYLCYSPEHDCFALFTNATIRSKNHKTKKKVRPGLYMHMYVFDGDYTRIKVGSGNKYNISGTGTNSWRIHLKTVLSSIDRSNNRLGHITF